MCLRLCGPLQGSPRSDPFLADKVCGSVRGPFQSGEVIQVYEGYMYLSLRLRLSSAPKAINPPRNKSQRCQHQQQTVRSTDHHHLDQRNAKTSQSRPCNPTTSPPTSSHKASIPQHPSPKYETSPNFEQPLRIKRVATLTPPFTITALLRLQRREIRARRVHALLHRRRPARGVSGSGGEVQELYVELWVQPRVA